MNINEHFKLNNGKIFYLDFNKESVDNFLKLTSKYLNDYGQYDFLFDKVIFYSKRINQDEILSKVGMLYCKDLIKIGTKIEMQSGGRKRYRFSIESSNKIQFRLIKETLYMYNDCGINVEYEQDDD